MCANQQQGLSKEIPKSIPAGKVKHEFGKNCAIDKYFGTHINNCAIVAWKNVTKFIKLYFLCICSNSFNNLVCHFLSKKMEWNTVIFPAGMLEIFIPMRTESLSVDWRLSEFATKKSKQTGQTNKEGLVKNEETDQQPARRWKASLLYIYNTNDETLKRL